MKALQTCRVRVPMKRIVLLISALALCVFGLSSCSSSSSGESTAAPLGSENNPVVVGTLATEDILPFWVAEAEDLFAQQGISVDIQVFQSATELIAGRELQIDSMEVDVPD